MSDHAAGPEVCHDRCEVTLSPDVCDTWWNTSETERYTAAVRAPTPILHQMSTPAIRLAHPDDADAILAIYAPHVRDTAVSFEVDVPTTAEMQGRIDDVLAAYPWLIVELDGVVAGYAYATRQRERLAYRWSVDVAVYVDADRHRSGIGRALYTSLLALLRLQGYRAAYAGITLPNPASVGLHEAMGFRRIGVYERVGFKLCAWHDVGWWGLQLLGATAAPPSEPLPLDKARAVPGWHEALSSGEKHLRVS